ncbi:MAG TPA: GtrA family protein [Alphaproteobacteria bacterium]
MRFILMRNDRPATGAIRVGPGIQSLRFAAVGIAATLVHFLTVAVLIDGLGFPIASVANVMGVVAGSSVSYFGNFFWTFRAEGRHVARVARFAIVYGLVFSLNGLIMLLATDIAGIPYMIPLVVSLCVTPVLTFLLNRHWVFA